MDNFSYAVASVHKRGYNTSASWCIDIRWDDGAIWQSWGYSFPTKKSAIEYCRTIGVKLIS